MNCYRCGEAIEGNYYAHFFKSCNSTQPICFNCFNELFWSDVFKDKHTVIINGIAYHATNNPSSGGYGGKEFHIQMNDGTIRKVGLWMNGKIPKEYYKEDTAKFID